MPAWWNTDADAVATFAFLTQWAAIALTALAAIAGGLSYAAHNQHAAILRVEPRLSAAEDAIRPRRFPIDEREALVGALRPFAGKGAVTINSVMGDSETDQLAKELESIFVAAGFTDADILVGQVIFSGRPTGVTLKVRSQPESPPFAAVVQRALGKAGLGGEAAQDSTLAPRMLEIVVGHKPPAK